MWACSSSPTPKLTTIKHRNQRIVPPNILQKNYITKNKVGEVRNIFKARVGMSEFADNFSKDKRFMRTNWLCRWEVVFLGDRSSSSRGGCLSHWSQSLSLSVILTFWHLSEIFLTSFCHLSDIFLSSFCHLYINFLSSSFCPFAFLSFCLCVFSCFSLFVFLSLFLSIFLSVLAHLNSLFIVRINLRPV